MFKTKPIQLVQEDSEDLIQLINPEQDSDLKPEDLPGELSILPIKNTVLFPGVVIPITVGRQKSIKLVKKAYQGNRIIGVWRKKIPTLKSRHWKIYIEQAQLRELSKCLFCPMVIQRLSFRERIVF
jgi:ATP-dependent Lon protease